MEIFNNSKVSNINYKVLIINSDSQLIREFCSDRVGVWGNILWTSAEEAMKRLSEYVSVEENVHQLNQRNIKFEIRAYSHPPVIHGFLINESHLYFSHTELVKGKLSGGHMPYRYIQYNKSSQLVKQYYNCYNSWFNYYWEHSELKLVSP